MSASEPSVPCPNCGKPAIGQFCSSCGSPLAPVNCGACDAPLSPGAKFCHRCGTPVAAPAEVVSAPAAGTGNVVPWAVAGVCLLALVAMVAGQRMGRSSAGDQGETAAAQGGATPMGQAPDISQMSPEERAQRLYDRMMGAYERGRMDTVQMFAPMATQAYLMLDSLDVDQRYDLGRLAEISGNAPLAQAEADTILHKHPTHLLGLILAAKAAHLRKDVAAERDYVSRFVKAEPAERAKKLPEYELHTGDITSALGEARGR